PPPKRSVLPCASTKLPVPPPPALSTSVPLFRLTVPLLLNGVLNAVVPALGLLVTVPVLLLKALLPPKFSKVSSLSALTALLLMKVPFCPSTRPALHTAVPLLISRRCSPTSPPIVSVPVAPIVVVPVPLCVPPLQLKAPFTVKSSPPLS